MITNTPSFETNFQALPEKIQNKIKDYVPNVIDRTSQLQSNIKAIPEDVRTYIKGFVPTIVDHASRNKLYNQLQLETDQKIGLYGENLILKGLKLCNKLFENKKEWSLYRTEIENRLATAKLPQNSWYSPVPTLFCNALNNPTGKSAKALYGLYYINYGAAEALQQIDHKSVFEKHLVEFDINVKTNIEKNNALMECIRQQRNTEKTIYNVCGGKTKFHDLKILPWKGVKNFERYTSLKQIQIGETVMRGLDSNNRPFIAISIHGQRNFYDFEENIITVVQQMDSEDPTKWFNHGTHGGLLYNSAGGSLSRLGIKTGEIGPFSILGKNNMEYDTKCYVVHGKSNTRIDNLFPTLQQLLTTGNCPYDYKIEDMKKYYESIGGSYKAENCSPAMFKLKEQM